MDFRKCMRKLLLCQLAPEQARHLTTTDRQGCQRVFLQVFENLASGPHYHPIEGRRAEYVQYFFVRKR